jgi:hypothetical protein
MSRLRPAVHAQAISLIRKWWIPPALCAVVSIGMFVSSPTMAASDAEIHLGTAWFDIHHGLPLGSRVNDGNVVGPCYDDRPYVEANCHTTPEAADIQLYTGSIINYPPPWYWVMGVGEIATGTLSGGAAGDGGRVFGLIACMLLLLLAASRLHRSGERSAIWCIYLLSPPVATFLWSNGNPNGWEIACALFFSATLLFRRDALLDPSSGVRPYFAILVAGLLLSTSRPSGALWLVAISVVCTLWTGAWRVRKSMVKLVALLLPAVAVNVTWNALFPQPGRSWTFGVATGKQLSELTSALAASVQDVFEKAEGLWGILGWQDTHPSALVYVGLIAVLIYFFPTYAPSRLHRQLLIAILLIVFCASVFIEAKGWSAFPAWWQDRYGLPLLAGLSMFLFSDPKSRERPGIFALAAWVTILNAYMICLNYWRYDYGILNGIPIQVARSAYGNIHSATVYGVVLVLLFVSAVLFVLDRECREELNFNPEPPLKKWPNESGRAMLAS